MPKQVISKVCGYFAIIILLLLMTGCGNIDKKSDGSREDKELDYNSSLEFIEGKLKVSLSEYLTSPEGENAGTVAKIIRYRIKEGEVDALKKVLSNQYGEGSGPKVESMPMYKAELCDDLRSSELITSYMRLYEDGDVSGTIEIFLVKDNNEFYFYFIY